MESPTGTLSVPFFEPRKVDNFILKQTWFGKPAHFKVINNGYTIYVGKDMKVHNSFVLGSLVFKRITGPKHCYWMIASLY